MPEWFGGAALGSGLLLPPSDQWKAQWARVERWRLKVEQIRAKAVREELDAFDLDGVIAYLQNCYHLRDWLEASRPAFKVPLDALFQKHFELGACRGVCNGFKHKAVKRPSHDADFNLYREYDHFLGDSEPERHPVLSPMGSSCASLTYSSSRTPASPCGPTSSQRRSKRLRTDDAIHRDSVADSWSNNAVEQTARSHSLAAAAHRER
jgi:hypothetical protein